MAFLRRFLSRDDAEALAACTALDIGTEFAKALVFEIDEAGHGTVRGVGRKRQGLSHMQSGTVADITAVVGVWYVLAGFLGLGGDLPQPLPWLMIAAGAGYVAIGYGFAVGGQRHPLAAVGGVTLAVASAAFLAWLGIHLVSGSLEVLAWNA